ncbi:MAG: hypothetical protein GX132_01450 [Erysipelotrichia bacterium]|jgi:hypothetical protein|nr:hypothetical protein [Erysipelotrichia bacterium]
MNDFRDKVIEHSYLIVLILSILIYLLFSLLDFSDPEGKFTLPSYDHWLGWVMYVASVIIPTIIGTLINQSLRKMAYNRYRKEETIAKLYKEYHELITKVKSDRKVHMTEVYMKKEAAKDLATKTIIGFGLSFIFVNILVSPNLEMIVATILNLLLWLGFGISSMVKLYDYGMTDGKEAIQRKINELRKEQAYGTSEIIQS